MNYVPYPIKCNESDIPDEVMKILEKISRNTHEVWAEGKMRDGWQYNEFYSANTKMHPNLVPFEQLIESDKQYDRNTSLGVIKCLIAEGFEIRRKG